MFIFHMDMRAWTIIDDCGLSAKLVWRLDGLYLFFFVRNDFYVL